MLYIIKKEYRNKEVFFKSNTVLKLDGISSHASYLLIAQSHNTTAFTIE